MEDGGKRKRFGLSLKSSKKINLELCKVGSRKSTEKPFSTEAKAQAFAEYSTKTSEDKIQKDRQNSNSTRQHEIPGLSISSTRMKLLDLMPVFPDWEKMEPLPVSSLMKSFSNPEKISSTKSSDLLDENSKSPELNDNAKTLVDTDYKDLPWFTVQYFARRMRLPSVTFDDNSADYFDTDGPVSSGALEFDLKSNGDKINAEHNFIKAGTFDGGKFCSRIKAKREVNDADIGKSMNYKCNELTNRRIILENDGGEATDAMTCYGKKSIRSQDVLKHDAEEAKEDMKGNERSFRNSRRFSDQHKTATSSMGCKIKSNSPVAVVNINKETTYPVQYRGKELGEYPEVLENGVEKTKSIMKCNEGQSSGSPKLFEDSVKKTFENTIWEGEKLFHSPTRCENRVKGRTSYTRGGSPDMFQRNGPRTTDTSRYTGGKSILPPNKAQKILKNTVVGSGESLLTRTGVSGSYQKLNAGKKHNVGFRFDETLHETVGKRPTVITNISRENGARNGNVCGTENQSINHYLSKEDDGLVDFMNSLGNDLDDDDLVSWCDDLMSPNIPVRKSTALATSYNYTKDSVGNTNLSKGAKRRLLIQKEQFNTKRSSNTNTFVRNRGIAPTTPSTSKPKNVGENLGECPICLEHFHSGLSKIDIDQHLERCCGGEEVMDDNDESFW